MLKRLSLCIRQYKKASILAPIFVTLEVVMEVLIPAIMAVLIDTGIEAGDMAAIKRIGLILIIARVISLVCGA